MFSRFQWVTCMIRVTSVSAVFRQVAAALAFSQTHSVIGAAVAFISVFIIQESHEDNDYLTPGKMFPLGSSVMSELNDLKHVISAITKFWRGTNVFRNGYQNTSIKKCIYACDFGLMLNLSIDALEGKGWWDKGWASLAGVSCNVLRWRFWQRNLLCTVPHSRSFVPRATPHHSSRYSFIPHANSSRTVSHSLRCKLSCCSHAVVALAAVLESSECHKKRGSPFFILLLRLNQPYDRSVLRVKSYHRWLKHCKRRNSEIPIIVFEGSLCCGFRTFTLHARTLFYITIHHHCRSHGTRQRRSPSAPWP